MKLTFTKIPIRGGYCVNVEDSNGKGFQYFLSKGEKLPDDILKEMINKRFGQKARSFQAWTSK